MELDFDINKTVEKIAMRMKENQEEFIIETIHPWCKNTLQIKISKEGLKQILLNGIQKQQSEDTGEISDGYHTFNQLYHQRAILFATIVNQNEDKSWKSFKHSDGNYCFDSNGEWFIVGIDTPKGSYTYHYEKKYWEYFKCKELECGKPWDGHTEEDVTRLLSLETQPCGDCISRDGAVDIINGYAEQFNSYIGTPNDSEVYAYARGLLLNIERNISALSPVTPSRPKGEWVGFESLDGSIRYMCDDCKEFEYVNYYNFCPNCGADMRGDDEE